MMIDIEVVERKNNNYLFLLFFLLGGFIYTLRNILYNIGILKIKNFLYKDKEKFLIDSKNGYNIDITNDSRSVYKDIIQEANYYEDSSFNREYINKISSLDLESMVDIKAKFKDLDKYLPNLDFNVISDGNKLKNITNQDILINYIDNINYDKTNYLLIIPDWDSAFTSVSQITAIGEILYSKYNAYIYIVSAILLLAMLGAIILTADYKQDIKLITIIKNKKKSSNIFAFIILIKDIFIYINRYLNIFKYLNNYSKHKISGVFVFSITPFYDIDNINIIHSEDILGSLPYYVVSNIVIGLLLLFINSYFSLSNKYLDKGGGFECGFTSFLQTRERYNVVFYRVSLLFLVFDLEIILAFPFPAIYQRDENFGKNNILVFLFILFVGFIYELKEGALNIVKTAHSVEIKVTDE